MEKLKVTYVDLEGNILFNNNQEYLKIPLVGRFVIWHLLFWEVISVMEDWDNNNVIVVGSVTD